MTISLADLFLEKVQIVKMGEKDAKDIAILLLEHELGDQDKGSINAEYISKLMADDWGFYYTTITNLRKLETMWKPSMFSAPKIRKRCRQRSMPSINELRSEVNRFGGSCVLRQGRR